VTFTSNTIKVALTVLGAILIAFVGYRFMKDVPILGQGRVISAVFSDSKGLAPGRTVTLKGVQIGTIRTVSLLPSDSVLIEMNLDDQVVLTQGSVAYIKSADLLGTMVIEIVKGNSTEVLPNNASIPGRVESGSVEALTSSGKEIADNAVITTERLNAILANVDATMNEPFRRDLQNITRNIEQLTRNLSVLMTNDRAQISSTIKNLNAISTNLAAITTDNRESIDGVIVGMDSTMASVETLTRQLSTTTTELNSILNKMNKGEGTLGKIAADSSLYHNIDSLTVNLSNLLKNIESNPRRYLRGMIKVF